MASTKELKEITAQKRALAMRQKIIREKLNGTKEERKELRSQQAEARKAVREQKATLRDLTATVYGKFSEGTAEDVNTLADQIMEVASDLAGTVRKFAEAKASLEDL